MANFAAYVRQQCDQIELIAARIPLSELVTKGQIVHGDVEVLLDVSQATANRILKRMVKEGLIYQDGNGRNTKYKKI